MTLGCDTSFLMRLLTEHPQPLASRAIEYADRRMLDGDIFEISDIVLSEAYYALQASYGVSKQDALMLLGKVAVTDGFSVSGYAREILAMPNLAKANLGFVDRLIHGAHFAAGKTTVSCEKSFKRLPLAEIVREG